MGEIVSPNGRLLNWNDMGIRRPIRASAESACDVLKTTGFHPTNVWLALVVCPTAAASRRGAWGSRVPFAVQGRGMAVVALTVPRTALKDRTLRAELPGYGRHAARVRSRLIPGVW